jgi:ribosomal-protein-alanine N-acetyltransferase
VDVPAVRSERLDLVWTSPEFMQASLDGKIAEAERLIGAALPAEWPDDEKRMRQQLKRVLDDPEQGLWIGCSMVRRADSVYVGGIGFHGKPNEFGQVELGYGVEPQYRRQGYASEAALALIDWARREQGVRRFVLRISPTNQPSLGMAAKLGFQQIGTQIDEIDGEEYVFELVIDG